jgi:glycosyltransferase involved in cell wall biosynthesis
LNKKNIVFICGSLEQGFDGVGDYTRRLAGEVVRLGHTASILAINDNHIIKETEELQETDGVYIPTLRLPQQLPGKTRLKIAEKFLIHKNPEWVSLQFVPYAFHRKGLPFGLARFLAKISNGNKWHIMFHELWVGNENIKNKTISFFQKRLIKALFIRLKPSLIHTHLPIYFHQLESMGQVVSQLPLFSNIPVVHNSEEKKAGYFTVGFFSQADSSISIRAFLKELNKELLDIGKEIQILFVGGNETKMRMIGDVMEEEACFKNKVKYTGYLLAEEVSKHLQICDLGITSLPLYTLGKSGSVAAFLAHGVPVAVPDCNTFYLEFEKPFFNEQLNKALLLKPSLIKFDIIKKSASSVSQHFIVSHIAREFLKDLSK